MELVKLPANIDSMDIQANVDGYLGAPEERVIFAAPDMLMVDCDVLIRSQRLGCEIPESEVALIPVELER
jgi:hypothetical protein